MFEGRLGRLRKKGPDAEFWEGTLFSCFLLKLAYSCERVSGVECGIIFFLLLPELVLTDFYKQGPGCFFVLPPEIPDSVRDPK